MSNFFPVIPNFDLDDVLARAYHEVGRVSYKLGKGGRDPRLPSCGGKKYVGKPLESDCVGFTSWAWGHDRFHPDYQYYGGWMNTDSIHKQALKPDPTDWFVRLAEPEVGALIVYPGVYMKGEKVRIGHIGIIVGLGTYAVQGIKGLDVIHCSKRYNGVSITKGQPWHGKQYCKGETNKDWASLFVWPEWRIKHG